MKEQERREKREKEVEEKDLGIENTAPQYKGFFYQLLSFRPDEQETKTNNDKSPLDRPINTTQGIYVSGVVNSLYIYKPNPNINAFYVR